MSGEDDVGSLCSAPSVEEGLIKSSLGGGYTAGGLTDDDMSSKASSAYTDKDRSTNSSQKKEKFVQKESTYISYLRIIVVLILVLTAVAICVVVYLITDGSESQNVESNFQADAKKITESFMDIAQDKIGAAGSVVVAIVAHGIDHVRDWPFVTLSSFQERSTTALALSGALNINLSPVVEKKIRGEWENYTQGPDSAWYEQGRTYQQYLGYDDLDNRPGMETNDPNLDLSTGVANHVFDYLGQTTSGKAEISPQAERFLPIWQTSPVPKRSNVNEDSSKASDHAMQSVDLNQVVFGPMQFSNPGFSTNEDIRTAEIAWLLSVANKRKTYYDGDIYTNVYFPLYDSFTRDRKSVGVMRIILHWARYFANILPETAKGVVVVLQNSCEEPYTYQIDGSKVKPLGHGDLHDPKYDSFVRYTSFLNVSQVEDGTATGMEIHHDSGCVYGISVYPSDEYAEQYQTNTPMVITLAVAIVFLFTICMFFVYDWLVERRQKVLLAKATRTHQIVASFFPKHVRDQILSDDIDEKKAGRLLGKKGDDEDGDEEVQHEGASLNEAPIADLFPEASVLFADIAGFTAWSSSREPQQVFILLQNVYHAFDLIAKHRKVFKVETVGDSYVAAAGVPEPQSSHAVIMSRFAWECLLKMNQVTRDLESLLGPDTGELTMRIGIHSGAVTAGVLRGERSRFQLFGDTVNTAARMESTGLKGRIQCSQSTAEALTIAGKEHWIRPREEMVSAKGKGIMKTFWIVPNAKAGSHSGSSDSAGTRENVEYFDVPQEVRAQGLLKRERQIDWVTELLADGVRHVIAKRDLLKVQSKGSTLKYDEKISGQIPLEDIVETIRMPEINTIKSGDIEERAKRTRLPERITTLLRQYVSIIASAYQNNPFHSFEHACHVTMSVHKFIKRIMANDLNQEVNKMVSSRKGAPTMSDYTHAIISDPVAQLAIVMAAVIHDVDHRGISNAQLAKEDPSMAARYREKSLAEQNSFEISWDLLMADHFNELRAYVFALPEDLIRFRQVLVNLVLATDIFDKEFNDNRKKRWNKAFSAPSGSLAVDKEVTALRATIVMEHIIQASDVCHVMQHFHVYQKWNRKLFQELYVAYQGGRMAVDPSTFWYSGELNFFDSYIIPLARKLQDCHVFGISSDECLNYAVRNRSEWESRGESIVAEMVEQFSSPSAKAALKEESD